MLITLCIFILQYHFVSQAAAQPPKLLYQHCVAENGVFKQNSAYQTNLNILLSSLHDGTTNNIRYGFYNSSYGDDADKAYAVALCRPDMTPDECRKCVNTTSWALTTNCSTNKEAIGGYDDRGTNYCMLRYAARNILNLMENAPYFFVHSVEKNVTENVDSFVKTRGDLLKRLRMDVDTFGNSSYKYAYGSQPVSNDVIYALVQCTPDLSKADCEACLFNATERTTECCSAREKEKNGTTRGGRVIYPSCNFRYETNNFIPSIGVEPTPESPPPPPGPDKGNIIAIVVSVVGVFMVALICIYIFYRRRRNAGYLRAGEEIKDADCTQFDLATIRVATDNFSEANELGKGGFGHVFKGKLPNGQEIAVKRLSRDSKQGETEFTNEVRLVAKLQHRNLVKLIGFCVHQRERLLIYEYLPNASLDHFIFDPIKRRDFDWDRRHKIIGGIARGLLYLHEDSRNRIIHRDLKASNILLDEEMNPKISDFGMARLFEMDQTQDNASRIVGTFGYMAPEYVYHGRCSVKSDVFSFGVLVLEIVSGQRRSNFRNNENTDDGDDLLTYAWKRWNEGRSSNLIDPTLVTGSQDDMVRYIHIGLLCVQESISDRPTMATVVSMLRGDLVNLLPPLIPGFFLPSGRVSEVSPSGQLTTESDKNDVTITELYPRN